MNFSFLGGWSGRSFWGPPFGAGQTNIGSRVRVVSLARHARENLASETSVRMLDEANEGLL